MYNVFYYTQSSDFLYTVLHVHCINCLQSVYKAHKKCIQSPLYTKCRSSKKFRNHEEEGPDVQYKGEMRAATFDMYDVSLLKQAGSSKHVMT